MIRIILVSLICILASPTTLLADGPISKLEKQFINDADMVIKYRQTELPNDVRAIFYAGAGTERIANYGETFNETDYIKPEYPYVQHQFSLVSKRSAAILYKKGGFTPFQFLIVFDRTKPYRACQYQVGWSIKTAEALRILLSHKEETKGEYLLSDCLPVKIRAQKHLNQSEK